MSPVTAMLTGVPMRLPSAKWTAERGPLIDQVVERASRPLTMGRDGLDLAHAAAPRG